MTEVSLESKKVPQPNHLVNFWNLPKRFHFPKTKTSNLQCCNILLGLLGAFFVALDPNHLLISSHQQLGSVFFGLNWNLEKITLKVPYWIYSFLFGCTWSSNILSLPGCNCHQENYTCHRYWVGSKDIDILKLHMLGNSLWPFLGWLQ